MAKRLTVISTFIWIGFVCSISFMEAWLKFQAPDVSLAIGLGIGKLIFSALNKVEWILAITMVACASYSRKKHYLLLTLPICILVLQTLWLIPALNERADLIIQGLKAPASSIHFVYIALEFVKVLSLFVFGVRSLSEMSEAPISLRENGHV